MFDKTFVSYILKYTHIYLFTHIYRSRGIQIHIIYIYKYKPTYMRGCYIETYLLSGFTVNISRYNTNC